MTQTVHHDHPENATAFVANDSRAHWHDQSLWFVRSKRDKAAATLPEWEELRQRASAIKLHTMSRLADYLEQFERNATKLGAVVHWDLSSFRNQVGAVGAEHSYKDRNRGSRGQSMDRRQRRRTHALQGPSDPHVH